MASIGSAVPVLAIQGCGKTFAQLRKRRQVVVRYRSMPDITLPSSCPKSGNPSTRPSPTRHLIAPAAESNRFTIDGHRPLKPANAPTGSDVGAAPKAGRPRRQNPILPPPPLASRNHSENDSTKLAGFDSPIHWQV